MGTAYIGLLEDVGGAIGEPWRDSSYRRSPCERLTFAFDRAAPLSFFTVGRLAWFFSCSHDLVGVAVYDVPEGGVLRWAGPPIRIHVPYGCMYVLEAGAMWFDLVTNMQDQVEGDLCI